MRLRDTPRVLTLLFAWGAVGVSVITFAIAPAWAQVGASRTAKQDGNAQAESTSAAAIALGQSRLRERRYPESMERFELVLNGLPKSPDARQGEVAAATAWALEEVRAQHPDNAMAILERAIKQVPDDPELLANFGIEATALGQLPIAEQALKAAEKLRPQNPKTVYGLARLEIEKQDLPDAERDLKAYLALRPEDASAYFALGHVYAMEQRDNEARTAFEQSIKLQPAQTESYYQIGQLDLQEHREDQAKALFANVLARDPKHAGALTGMGELALRLKDYATAERLLAKAEQSDPTYPAPHYFRGLALVKLGRKDEAQEELRRGDSRPHSAVPGEAGKAVDAQEATGSSKPQE